MTPEEAYESYLAMKLHFSGKYDFVKYGGRVNRGNLSSRRDKYKFVKLSKKEDVKLFLASNFARDPRAWVGDLIEDPAADAKYSSAKSFVESASYRLEQELSLFPHSSFNDNLRSRDRKPPPVVSSLGKGVSMETLAVLDRMTGFLSVKDCVDPTYESLATRIRSYSVFLDVSDETVRTAVKKIFPDGEKET